MMYAASKAARQPSQACSSGPVHPEPFAPSMKPQVYQSAGMVVRLLYTSLG